MHFLMRFLMRVISACAKDRSLGHYHSNRLLRNKVGLSVGCKVRLILKVHFGVWKVDFCILNTEAEAGAGSRRRVQLS
jgi:hypothetical protein